MSDDQKGKAATGITITTLLLIVAALGTNLKGIAEGIDGLWKVLLAFSEKAPLGLSSFLIALTLSGLVIPPYRFIVRRYVPKLEADAELRRFVAGALALAVAWMVMYAQLPTLQGTLLGIMAGLLSPWIVQGIGALRNWITRALAG